MGVHNSSPSASFVMQKPKSKCFLVVFFASGTTPDSTTLGARIMSIRHPQAPRVLVFVLLFMQYKSGEGGVVHSHKLRVRNSTGGEVSFKIKKHSTLKKLMEAYCQRIGTRIGEVRFMVDGERVGENDTPDALGLHDDDLIDVAVEQTGGGFPSTTQRQDGGRI
ncbi:unnamed protein product [Amoebophrya sp. A120]|nr:unnamed protein product [Amoebophrya sp. A120]|eukprot:GSA120T00008542001.1